MTIKDFLLHKAQVVYEQFAHGTLMSASTYSLLPQGLQVSTDCEKMVLGSEVRRKQRSIALVLRHCSV